MSQHLENTTSQTITPTELGRVFERFVGSASSDLKITPPAWSTSPNEVFQRDEAFFDLVSPIYRSIFVYSNKKIASPSNVLRWESIPQRSGADTVVVIARHGISPEARGTCSALGFKYLDVPDSIAALRRAGRNTEDDLYRFLISSFRHDLHFNEIKKERQLARDFVPSRINPYYEPHNIPKYEDYFREKPFDEEIIRKHGLTSDEYEGINKMLGRTPTLTELGIVSVMWSEHCSYKSSRIWLKTLPTDGPQVIQGPGENAGVVDLGDGDAAVFKMESHNHPSYIEPYQGAATGVGGIMRDVFTMGARPVANMNALRFGSPEHAKTRHLVSGVVSGIGDYGNCMGVPTIGGETNFDARYDGNILVNAMCVGLVDANRIFKSAARGVGLPVVYVGSKTGRDGIHGATMASAEFDDASAEKRPTVQVGDPFTEKLLLEACLELMAEDVIIGIQDMGAAGLTSSSVEMADKGGVGIELDLDKVPCREEAMTAYEMMLSESQERMLMVLKPGAEPQAEAIFKKWELDFAVIGVTTDTGRFVIKHQDAVEADLPLSALADGAPIYERPWVPKEPQVAPKEVPAADGPLSSLEALMGTPNLCSKRWIWEQYDHMVMADTVARPGGDAGVVRVHGTNKGIAVSCDVTPRYCAGDAFEGAKQAVAECWRNLTAVGADPLAITDCMNFGNPERPEIMGEFVAAVKGMGEACTALSFPVVSGNVSLYNETNGVAIPPTPAIGGVGLIPDVAKMAGLALAQDGDALVVLGETKGHLHQSRYQEWISGKLEGPPPSVDLEAERKAGDFVRGQIRDSKVTAVHDVSDGGLLVAVAEMALAGRRGVALDADTGSVPSHGFWFGEDQGRYVVSVPSDGLEALLTAAREAGLPALKIGDVGSDSLTLGEEPPLPLATLRSTYEQWLPDYMEGGREQ